VFNTVRTAPRRAAARVAAALSIVTVMLPCPQSQGRISTTQGCCLVLQGYCAPVNSR
jgi:hypothetical protein